MSAPIAHARATSLMEGIMKRFQALVACLALLIPNPAFAGQPPSFSVANASAIAGSSSIPFTVTRSGGNGQSSVLTFATGSGSARAGIDYRSTIVAVTFGVNDTSETVSVPLLGTKPMAPISFTVTIRKVSNAIVAVASAMGTITPAVAPPPPPATQTCPDGSVIPATNVCPAPTPVPPPVPSPTPAPTTLPVNLGVVTATKNCSSLWRNARTDAVGITMPSVVAGQKYQVTSEPAGQQGGLVPNNYTGAFVIALPVGGTDSQRGDYEFDPSCFQ